MKSKIKKNKILFGLIVFLGLVTLFSVYRAFQKPAPVRLENNELRYSNTIRPPHIFMNETGSYVFGDPEPMFFNFFTPAIKDMSSIGKDFTRGIRMRPNVPGNWRWVSENSLIFTPENHWAPGETYRIRFDRSLFREGFTLSRYEYEISIAPNNVTITQFRLFQDPANPRTHQLQAVFFSDYPLDTAYFERNLSLRLDGRNINHTVAFSQLDRVATVTSDPVRIISTDQTAVVSLSGARSTLGGRALRERVSSEFIIPSDERFFYISSVTSNIAFDDENNPEQIIAVQFTDGINPEQMQGKVSVYLLPALHPDQPNARRNHSWRFGEANEEVLRASQRIDIEQMPAAADTVTDVMFRYRVTDLTNRYLYVRIDEGISSQIGLSTRRPVSNVIRVTPFPRKAQILQDGAIIPLGGSRRLTFVTRGVASAQFDIARVFPEQINHMISQTFGNFATPQFMNRFAFNEQNISQMFTRTLSLNAAPDRTNYSSLDLNEFLTGAQASGMFFVRIRGLDEGGRIIDAQGDNRFILVTDLALIVKRDIDNRNNVFVKSISRGTGAAGVRVNIIGRNGIAVASATTDATGFVQLPDVSNFRNERQPVAFVATRGNDLTFMGFNRHDRFVNYSRFDIGGEHVVRGARGAQGDTRAFVFTDRGIYRPGEDAQIGVIVRNTRWASLAGVPVQVVITDPFGQTALERLVTLNDKGFFEVNFQTTHTAQAGRYNANVYLVHNDRREFLLGNTHFMVEEFRRDNLTINATILNAGNAGWETASSLQASVILNNLFGTPSQNSLVRANVRLVPTVFHFPQFRDYAFTNPQRSNARPALSAITTPLPERRTDDDGFAGFEIDTSRYSGGTFNLAFTAEGFEGAGGAGVMASYMVRFSPHQYLVGHRTTARLNYLTRNSRDNFINIIAVNPNLEQVGIDNITLRLVEQEHVSSLVRAHDGAFRHQTVPRNNTILETTISIDQTGFRYTVPTNTPGHFFIELEDADGNIILNVPFFVAGARAATMSLERDAALIVRLQNDDIPAGGTLTMNITAPYAGSGLITIERDRVFAHRWFTLTSNSGEVSIQVPPDLEGGAYVNVSFMRAQTSREVFTSPHSFAVVPFRIDRARRTLNPELRVPAMVKPGEYIEISYRTARPAQIIVYAVDEGILQVARYVTPNPLAFFFRRMALQVSTMQTVDMILPDFRIIRELAGIGGGFADMEVMADMAMARAAMGANLNPFGRRQTQPVVFWSGILESNRNFQTVRFRVPDHFNGRMRVMAVAVASDAVGHAEAHTLVRANVILTPMTPLFVAPDDSFQISVTVANNFNQSAQVNLSLATNDKFQIDAESSRNLEIPAGAERVVTFNLRALHNLGNGEITFTASANNETFTSRQSVSVRPANAFRTQINAGTSTNRNVAVNNFARDMHPEFAERSLAVSHNPLVVALGLRGFFEHFPFDCTEQLISRVFPFLGVPQGIIPRDELDTRFNELIAILRLRQTASGGFTMWDRQTTENDFVTVYAMHFLTDARDLNFPVPDILIRRGITRLERIAGARPSGLDNARLIAYANYVLTRNRVITVNNLTRLEEYLTNNHRNWQQDLTAVYMAASYAILRDARKADSLIRNFQPQTGERFIVFCDFDTFAGRNAMYLYLLGKHFPERLTRRAVTDIADDLVASISRGNFNTLSAGLSILALNSYGRALENRDEYLSANAVSQVRSAVQPIDFDRSGAFPTFAFGADITAFNITTGTNARLYYVVTQSGFDSRPAAPHSNGIEVIREYLNDAGRPVTSVNLGEELTVRIRVRADLANRRVTSVAIVDLLPGGLEFISGSFTGQAESYNYREDRVVIHNSLGVGMVEYTYRVRAVTQGTFTVPAIFAASLYDPSISSLGTSTTIEVK